VLWRYIPHPLAFGEKVNAKIIRAVHVTAPDYVPVSPVECQIPFQVTKGKLVVKVVRADKAVGRPGIDRSFFCRLVDQSAGGVVYVIEPGIRLSPELAAEKSGPHGLEYVERTVNGGQGPDSRPGAETGPVADNRLDLADPQELAVRGKGVLLGRRFIFRKLSVFTATSDTK